MLFGGAAWPGGCWGGNDARGFETFGGPWPGIGRPCAAAEAIIAGLGRPFGGIGRPAGPHRSGFEGVTTDGLTTVFTGGPDGTGPVVDGAA